MRARKPRGSFSSSDSDAAIAVEQREALADVGEADAAPSDNPAVETRAGVGHDESTRWRRRTSNTHVDAPAARAGLDAVLDRVLGERDDHARRDRAIGDVVGNVHRPREAPSEPRLHDAEIGADHRGLLADRRHLVAQRGCGGAQEADELADEARGLRRALFRELLRAAERVEQEVRLDLQLQQLELRLGELARRLALPRLGFEMRGRARGTRDCAGARSAR